MVRLPEVSVVIPCLNEADTVATCVAKALSAFRNSGIEGEVIVADNGSADRSTELAAEAGARVVIIRERGYGHALMGGIEAARGELVIMGDADDSYDFTEVPRFVDKLREGFDLVQGCRLPSGGGSVQPGAMPFLHYWLGNPFFSWLARILFRVPVHDIYCGLRGFRRRVYVALDQRCTGMEFATEMVIKASLENVRIAEIPITLHRDGRVSHPPHLSTLRDGWRTLRFMLLFSPGWLFLGPCVLLSLAGILGYGLALSGSKIGRATFDAHTLLVASLALICGLQAGIFYVVVRTVGITGGLVRADRRLMTFFQLMNLERGLAVGACGILAGLGLLLAAANEWWLAGFGPLDYARTMRMVIPGATLVALSLQGVLSAFLVSVLAMQRRHAGPAQR